KTKSVATGKEAALQVDKSAQRMSEKDREVAKERLKKEWGDEEQPVAAAAMGGAASPSSGAGMGAGAGAGDSGVKALVAAATAKLGSIDAAKRAKLEQLVGALKSAAARGDHAATARADEELTNYLFELD